MWVGGLEIEGRGRREGRREMGERERGREVATMRENAGSQAPFHVPSVSEPLSF